MEGASLHKDWVAQTPLGECLKGRVWWPSVCLKITQIYMSIFEF